MSHRLGWVRDCRTAVGCRPVLFAPPYHAHRLGYGTGVEHDDRPFRPSSTRQKGTPATSLARVQFFSVSLDGFGTGEGLSHDAPFGHAGERLHEWMLATRWWHKMVGEPGGGGGIDDAVLRLHDPGIGAEIMGAGKFGYPGWHEDPAWKGWWGDEPPFHTPVFVLTHHPRPSIEMKGGTTFHFLDAAPAEALETARDAASGQDVRIGGGPTMVRDFLAAGLVDHAHIVVVPILLGRGVRLWDGLEGLEKDYQVEAISSPSGVTHVTFTRTGV
jgi:dihydrofolate reductase